MTGLRVWAAACALAIASHALAQHDAFTPAEVQAILRHGPWPQPVLRDPSNRVSGDPAAVRLGELLFFERRLSPDGAMSCARCHQTSRALADGRRVALGTGELPRNTPTVWNVALGRWFGWGGGSDSLWSFSIRPLLHPQEMGSSAAHVARVLRGDVQYACLHREAFGDAQQDDEHLLVDAAKAIAAYMETLVSAPTPFDAFRDALARGDAKAMAQYPEAAKRGLRIFVGRGNCSVCHFGPMFTNGEFGDVGIPFFVKGGVDAGRHAGIRQLLADRYNLAGRFSDDASGRSASKTKHVHLQQRNFGEFKVPGLRNVALTAPYMHNGSLATLADVVRHYSELNEDRLHADGERVLQPLRLTAQESADLVAFLDSLTDPRARVTPAAPLTRQCAAPPTR